MSQTAIVALILVGLIVAATANQPTRVMFIMCGIYVIAVGFMFVLKQQPERDVVMILLDLAAIFALRQFCDGGRAATIALMSVFVMAIRTAHIAQPNVNQWTYAAVINTASAFQAIIGGGWLDAAGNRLLDWAGRGHPWLAGFFRHLARA